MTDPLRDLVAAMTPDGLRDLIRAALEGLAAPRQAIDLTPAQVEARPGRARMLLAIPQWAEPDGAPRGRGVRALSGAERVEAAMAAHQWAARKLGPVPLDVGRRSVYLIAYEAVQQERQTIEEAARMAELPVGLMEGLSDAIIQQIHAAGRRLEGLPAEIIAAELARLHGDPLPPATTDGERSDYPLTSGVGDPDQSPGGDAGGGPAGPPDG